MASPPPSLCDTQRGISQDCQDGSRWIALRNRLLFLPVKVLSRLFQKKFLISSIWERHSVHGELKIQLYSDKRVQWRLFLPPETFSREGPSVAHLQPTAFPHDRSPRW
jgi:hypothetical protein